MEWSQFFEEFGEGVGGGVRQVADQFTLGRLAVKASCTLTSFDPRFRDLTPYSRGFWRSVCSQAGFDVPPPTDGNSFQGGQCPEIYAVSGLRAKNGISHCDELIVDIPWGLNLQGPIRGIVGTVEREQAKIDCDTGQQIGTQDFIAAQVDHGSLENPQKTTIIFHTDDYASEQVVYITDVTRIDGLPDDCGNNDGSEQVDRDFDHEPTGEPSVTNYKIDRSVNIDNGITFNGGDTSITVSPDGISIDDNINDEVIDDTAGQEPGLPDADSDEWVVTDRPGVEEEEEELEEVEVEDEEIDWVLITITSFPINGKTILHNNPTDNDYFAGYFSWTIKDKGTFRLEQQAIRKQYTAFKAPENISGYRMYAVNGARLTLKEYKQVIPGEE